MDYLSHKIAGHERISVNNFAASINGELFGILNEGILKEHYKQHNQVRLVVGPIGGGAKQGTEAKDNIAARGGVDLHHKDISFFVPPDDAERCKDLFRVLKPSIFETTITRELVEELSRPEGYGLLGCWRPPALSPDDLLKDGTYYSLSSPQPIEHIGESKSFPGITTHYIWWLHHVYIMDDEVFGKLASSNHIFRLTETDIEDGYIKVGMKDIPIFDSLKTIWKHNKQRYTQKKSSYFLTCKGLIVYRGR